MKESVYATDVRQLDVSLPTLKYFVADAITITDASPIPGWTCTLTRIAPASSRRAYSVTFTQDGYDVINSTISAMPEIRPANCDAVGGAYRSRAGVRGGDGCPGVMGPDDLQGRLVEHSVGGQDARLGQRQRPARASVTSPPASSTNRRPAAKSQGESSYSK